MIEDINSEIENRNKKVERLKGGLYLLNSIFYISFLLQNNDKKYDILLLFFAITIVMFALNSIKTKFKYNNCFTFTIIKLMFLKSLLYFGVFIYFCINNYKLWPFIILYSIIVLCYYLLYKETSYCLQIITTNYKNSKQHFFEEKECPVCLDWFNNGYIYTCKHFICESCLNNWIQTSSNIKCVTCRTGHIDLIL